MPLREPTKPKSKTTIIRAAKAAQPPSMSGAAVHDPEAAIEVQRLQGARITTDAIPTGRERALARTTLMQALLLEAGDPRSVVETANGRVFDLATPAGPVRVEPQRNVPIPIPGGQTTSHVSDIHLEGPDGRVVLVDVVDAHANSTDLKALSFDMQHLKARRPKLSSVLVFVRTPGSMGQEQAQAICHTYDYHFGVSEGDLQSALKFAACRAEILRRFNAGAR